MKNAEKKVQGGQTWQLVLIIVVLALYFGGKFVINHGYLNGNSKKEPIHNVNRVNKWAGVWVSTLNGGWVFQLNRDGTAEVQLASFGSYETEWTEDDGNAFIGGIGETRAFILTPQGEVYGYSKSGDISNTGIKMRKN